jgi:hypothetical protein
VKALTALFARRGEPAFIRSDNGPEFVAKAIKQRLDVCKKTLYIELGSTWKNTCSETFISCLGDELRQRAVFAELLGRCW